MKESVNQISQIYYWVLSFYSSTYHIYYLIFQANSYFDSVCVIIRNCLWTVFLVATVHQKRYMEMYRVVRIVGIVDTLSSFIIQRK